jgi:hypothetical protein
MFQSCSFSIRQILNGPILYNLQLLAAVWKLPSGIKTFLDSKLRKSRIHGFERDREKEANFSPPRHEEMTTRRPRK